jgi:hypothetical protein
MVYRKIRRSLPARSRHHRRVYRQLLLVAAHHAADIAASTLDSLGGLGTTGLDAIAHRVGDTAERTADSIAVLVLASSLRSVDTLLADHVANTLAEATLAELAGNALIDRVLELVDWLDARDLGLAELICIELE